MVGVEDSARQGLGAHTFLRPHDAATPASPLAAIARCPYAHSSPTAPSAPLYSPTRSSCAPPGCCTLPLFSSSAATRSYTGAAPGLPRGSQNANDGSNDGSNDDSNDDDDDDDNEHHCQGT